MTYGTILADTLQSSTAGTAPVFKDGNSVQIGTLCRAWVNFAGASGAINGSFNVSSVTRTGTGNYTVNFTNAMPDANYVFSGTINSYTGGYLSSVLLSTGGTLSSSSFPFIVLNAISGGSYFDSTYVLISVFR